jgi:hypothetical protein
MTGVWGVHRLSPELMSNMFFCINDISQTRYCVLSEFHLSVTKFLGGQDEAGATSTYGDFQKHATPTSISFSRHLRPPSPSRHKYTIPMAPAEPSSGASSAESLALPEIIFSCGICQSTVTEVYATPESNKGFHSGSGDDDGIVTRLWIAECSHVICGKHLPGGGRSLCRVRLVPPTDATI